MSGGIRSGVGFALYKHINWKPTESHPLLRARLGGCFSAVTYSGFQASRTASEADMVGPSGKNT